MIPPAPPNYNQTNGGTTSTGTCFEQGKVTCPGGGCADAYTDCTTTQANYDYHAGEYEGAAGFYDDPTTNWNPDDPNDFEGSQREDLKYVFDQLGGKEWTGLDYSEWLAEYPMPPSWEGSSYQEQADLLLTALGLMTEEQTGYGTTYDDAISAIVLDKAGLDLKETFLEGQLALDFADIQSRKGAVELLQEEALKQEEIIGQELSAADIEETRLRNKILDIEEEQRGKQELLNTKRLTASGEVKNITLGTEGLRRRSRGLGLGRTVTELDTLYGGIQQDHARDVISKNIDEARFKLAKDDIGAVGELDSLGDVLTHGTGLLGLQTIARANLHDRQDIVDLNELGYAQDLLDLDAERTGIKDAYVFQMGGSFVDTIDADGNITSEYVESTDDTMGAIDISRAGFDLDEDAAYTNYGEDLLNMELRRLGYRSDIEGIETQYENRIWDWILAQQPLLECAGGTIDEVTGDCIPGDPTIDGTNNGDPPPPPPPPPIEVLCVDSPNNPACVGPYPDGYEPPPDGDDTYVDCVADPDNPACDPLLDDWGSPMDPWDDGGQQCGQGFVPTTSGNCIPDPRLGNGGEGLEPTPGQEVDGNDDYDGYDGYDGQDDDGQGEGTYDDGQDAGTDIGTDTGTGYDTEETGQGGETDQGGDSDPWDEYGDPYGTDDEGGTLWDDLEELDEEEEEDEDIIPDTDDLWEPDITSNDIFWGNISG